MALSEYKIKVVDASNKPLLNFPMATRYVGGNKKNNKLTSDTDGTLTFQSNGQPVEIFVLAPIDENGQPDITKFQEDHDNDNAYYRIGTFNSSQKLPSIIKSPYFLTDYGIAKTKFIFYENEQDKKVYSIPLNVKVSYLVGEKKTAPQFIEVIKEVKNGELNITSILHSRIQVHPFKPDNTPFKIPQGYTPRSTAPITLPVYFDIVSIKDKTEPNQPDENKKIKKELCLCNRDMTLDELNKMILEMRKSEGLKTTKIFNHKNCTLEDRSVETLLKSINAVCKKYDINTCLRKINFMGQIYWETARFITTTEFASGTYLNPHVHKDAISNGNTITGDGPRYKGRGFLQLTWRNNYNKYLNYILKNRNYYSSVIGNSLTINELMDRKTNIMSGLLVKIC